MFPQRSAWFLPAIGRRTRRSSAHSNSVGSLYLNESMNRGAQGGLGNRKTGHSRIQKGPQWVKRGQYPAACPCWVRPGACPRAWPSCGICSPPRAPPRAISDGPMAAPLTHENFHSSGVSEAQNALCDRHHIGGLGNSLYTPRRGETPRNRVAVSRGHFRSSVLFNRNGALCA